MSDFPTPETYKTPNSAGHLRHFPGNDSPFVLKRAKNQYLYDIDNNKYADFYLGNGSVIYGHNFGTLTKFTKNGLSAGAGDLFVTKFQYRLWRLLSALSGSENIALYSSLPSALVRLAHLTQAETVGVNTCHLQELLTPYFKNKPEIIDTNRSYDLAVTEPVQFDGDLSPVESLPAQAKIHVSYETRAAFRLRYGFIRDTQSADYILSGSNIANGMDMGVIIGLKSGLPVLTGENLPAFKALSALETLKFYRRKIAYGTWDIPVSSPFIIHRNKNIAKLNRIYTLSELLPYGILLQGDTIFLSYLHTEHDVRRLVRALEQSTKTP